MAKPKPILIISYFFPPIGMAGSARAYGLFRHLPEFGYRPYIVTVKDIVYPAYDTTLLNASDERYIARTESLDPSRILWRLGSRKAPTPSLAGHLTKWITPDYKRLWVPFAIRAAKEIIARENIQLIMTTSPTPSAHIVGRSLCQECDVTWMADYRDMWVTQPIEVAYERESQIVQAQKLLKDFGKQATHVTAVNQSIRKYTGAQTIIPNGVDPLTSKLWNSANSSKTPTDKIFRIGYLGTTDSAETVACFVSALAEVINKQQLKAESVQVRFVGAVDEPMLRKSFAAVNLSQALECLGYMPRHQAIAALSDVDTLLVTIPQELSFVTPSKIFDCLVSAKPLIVIAPHGSELSNLAKSAGEHVFAQSEPELLQDYIAELLEQKAQNNPLRDSGTQLELRESRQKEYSWQTMAKRFAQVFDKMNMGS